MTFSELSDKLFSNYEAGAISNKELVKIIELSAVYLNLKTISNYAKSNDISYNGALKRKTERMKIDKIEFIVDNE